MAGAGRRVAIVAGDGFAGLRSVLPPPSRRGLVLIDPSYENASDYRAVQAAMRDALQRFATGTYAVWYPQLAAARSGRAAGTAAAARRRRLARRALSVTAPSADELRSSRQRHVRLQPAVEARERLRDAMPVLVEALGQDAAAAFKLEFRQT